MIAPDPLSELSFIELMGFTLHRVSLAAAVDHIAKAIDRGRGGWVLTPNLDIIRRIVTDPSFAALVSGTTLRLADGMPLVWASRLKGTPLPERVAGSDMIWSLSQRAAGEGRSVFLLGGNPGAADDAARILAERYPGLKIAGTECPALGFERDPDAMAALQARLLGARPDIVYVALGSPKQERLIQVLWPAMPSAWFLGIGISFSYVSGDVRRAPMWMRRTGLEWVYRLSQEPGRLARRYLVEGVPFAVRLFWRSLKERRQGTLVSL
ncbi:MAG: WecB/TagA/CpsF family glycosyltransferase [Phycisphaeraceae bacterium]|nr:WecB/TagA/CpsF family glycosyltransferase [Phycisphaeraceae bacterium]